MAVEAVMAYF